MSVVESREYGVGIQGLDSGKGNEENLPTSLNSTRVEIGRSQ